MKVIGMEMLGTARACDEHGTPHLFEVFRSPAGYRICLDAEEICQAETHSAAIQAIIDEAGRRNYHGRI